jgi:hypothetical protein
MNFLFFSLLLLIKQDMRLFFCVFKGFVQNTNILFLWYLVFEICSFLVFSWIMRQNQIIVIGVFGWCFLDICIEICTFHNNSPHRFSRFIDRFFETLGNNLVGWRTSSNGFDLSSARFSCAAPWNYFRLTLLIL